MHDALRRGSLQGSTHLHTDLRYGRDSLDPLFIQFFLPVSSLEVLEDHEEGAILKTPHV